MKSFAAAATLLATPVLGLKTSPATCPADVPISCQGPSDFDDTCCYNSPGGQVLLTQFWDTKPSTGPADSWTVHGLWPDNCDGSYEQYCDKNREYFNISTILADAAPCTLKYMQDYWKDYQGDDEDFWEHEFNKHGTCMSTLEPQCYDNYKPGDEVIDYFKRAVKLFKTLPSYKWLEDAGIVPSTTATYTLAQINDALKAHHGHDVIVNCKSGELDELWYHYNIKGSVQNGEYIPVDPVGSPSSCPKTGIRYLPKYQDDAPPSSSTSSTSVPQPTGKPGQLSGKGRVYVETSADGDGGFLISAGKWYRGGGTPATYTATPSGDGDEFSLKTSKGKCAVLEDSSLSCAAEVTEASLFSYDGRYLTYKGEASLYAESLPAGTLQGTVYTAKKAVAFKAMWTAT